MAEDPGGTSHVPYLGCDSCCCANRIEERVTRQHMAGALLGPAHKQNIIPS